jgi:hypothetical protein
MDHAAVSNFGIRFVCIDILIISRSIASRILVNSLHLKSLA